MAFLKRTLALLFLCSLLAAPMTARAQDEDDDAEMESVEEQDPPKADEKKSDEPKKNPDVEKYEKAIKDATKYEGAFTLYTRKTDILLELPEDAIGKTFMAQASLNRGFAAMMGQAGEPVGDGPVSVFQWEKAEDKVVLRVPRTRYRWKNIDPLAVASERTFPDAIVATFRIEQKHPEKKLLLINVTPFFQGQVFDLAAFVSESVGGQASPDREFTKVDAIRNVGDATVVRMDVHFKSQGEGGPMAELMSLFGAKAPTHMQDAKSIPFKVTYTLWYRPDDGYVPRLADSRIGYFTQDFFSVGRMSEVDRTERYIGRFNLRKKDPSLTVSEPVKPIVWTIDESVPERYRSGIKRGILEWNKAFEKIGFKNAVQVVDGPSKSADWDHADGLNNVVRWNMSEEMAYAIALFRMDPITGQILNASVSIDANFAEFVLQDYNFAIRQARPNRDLAEKALLRSQPGEVDALTSLMKLGSLERKGLPSGDWMRSQCDYANRLASESALSWALLKANGTKISEDDFMNQFVADLVMHEVGHCLGLRHNFAGSTQNTVAQLLDDARLAKGGLSASVMDYTPINTPAILRGNGVFFNTTVGPYDEWAIEYGYTPIYAADPKDEKGMLNIIAQKSGQPGHLFLTDEDADGVNPLAVRFDLGSDTVEWLKTQLKSSDSIRKYATNGLTKTGEDYGLRTNLLLGSFVRDFSTAVMASRFIGGVEARRNHKGDVGEKPTLAPVSPKTQRQAMKLIVDNVLMMEQPRIAPEVMNSLSLDPNSGSGAAWNAPLRDFLGMMQTLTLSVLMSARKADDIIENDFKMEKSSDRYTIAEHYNVLFAAVFKEVGANKKVTALRRDLQRYMIEGLITQASARAGSISDDVRVVAAQGLVRLKKRFDAQLASRSGLDELTVLHCQDISDRIAKYLDRTVASSR